MFQLTSGYNNAIDVADDPILSKMDVLKKPYTAEDLINRIQMLMAKH